MHTIAGITRVSLRELAGRTLFIAGITGRNGDSGEKPEASDARS
jgi:hypothetical protein